MLRISLESNSQVFLLTWGLGVNLNSFAKGFSLDLDKILQKKKRSEIETTDIATKQQNNKAILICHVLVDEAYLTGVNVIQENFGQIVFP